MPTPHLKSLLDATRRVFHSCLGGGGSCTWHPCASGSLWNVLPVFSKNLKCFSEASEQLPRDHKALWVMSEMSLRPPLHISLSVFIGVCSRGRCPGIEPLQILWANCTLNIITGFCHLLSDKDGLRNPYSGNLIYLLLCCNLDVELSWKMGLETVASSKCYPSLPDKERLWKHIASIRNSIRKLGFQA